MTESDAAPALSPPSISPFSSGLNKPRSELLTRIQGLKQDLQNWRSKLDTQAKMYHSELSELKKTLNVEVEQLKSEFQELRNTLQQQHEDVTTSLNNLGIQDASEEVQRTQNPPVTQNREVQTPTLQDSKEI
ncbi:uncharacterized protein LOC131225122 [Magnolia sinica]|uniref:uncharacterized protein LOC131225122 n=1 Tax=Magnolia sinica TaxID=86752 RepID=UPI002659B757|nr:uncharacterized protein LOC131225122 [Magnolia sinica]